RIDIRFCTAIALIGICGCSVAQGWSVARFSIAMVNIDSLKNRAEVTHAWSAVPGVAAAALQAELADKIDPSDLKAANSQRGELSAVLSIRPLSSVHWLSLSGMQLVTDQPMEKVLGSLELSVLTGPNEGNVMVERGIFGVSLWEDLPPDLKRHVAIDLAGGEITENEELEKLRAVFSTKPEEVRNALRTAVLATGLAPKEVERRLGF